MGSITMSGLGFAGDAVAGHRASEGGSDCGCATAKAPAAPRASLAAVAWAAFLAIVLALACACLPARAYAAASATAAKQSFTTYTQEIEKKAATVKGGTTKLTFPKGTGYVKFTATKAKTYSFTFSDVKTKKAENVFARAQTKYASNAKYSFTSDLKTKGGKSASLWMSANGTKFSAKMAALKRPIAKRTGSIKLAKGQVIYFYFNGKGKTTATLKIS